MNTNARKQLQLLQDLRQALEHNQFSLHYQPKFDAVSGQPVGAEALLRWEHPQQGLLLPEHFIELAEKNRADHSDRRMGAKRSLSPDAGVVR